jgi:thiol-disulfide isomerase/thioredoxin
MKKRLWCLWIVSVVLTLSVTTVMAADAIKWRSYSPAVFADAKKQHRLVLIFGEAEWCPWCKATKQETLKDPAVIAEVNAHYIPVMLNVDEQPAVADEYKILQLPTFVIVDENKKVLETYAGYTSPGVWADRFKQAAKGLE